MLIFNLLTSLLISLKPGDVYRPEITMYDISLRMRQDCDLNDSIDVPFHR
jgi:hypothetical protein